MRPAAIPVGAIDPGFNYVTVSGAQGDWIQINDGQWMPASQLAVARPSEFAGVYLDGALDYPMAWVLIPTYPSPASRRRRAINPARSSSAIRG